MVEAAGELAAAGLTIGKIAVSIGVTERTVYDWMREGKKGAESDLKVQFSQAIHKGWIETGKNYLQNLRLHAASQGGIPAATWFLTHHPFFRDDFSDAAAERRTERKTIAAVVDAIAAAGLTPEDERRVMLQINARGLETPEGEGEE
jgi:hypothetical protein